MDKDKILDYVMTSPANTNRAVLGDMLDSFEGGSGGGTEPLIVSENESGQLDHTWQEIYDAFPNVVFDGGNAECGVYQRNLIKSVGGEDNQYLVVVNDVDDVSYRATSTSGYPKGKQ